jgi:uncharacterized Fe-S cluster-containing radical SAM superfamily protein
MSGIDTDAYSARLRTKALDPVSRRILLADLRGSEQEADLKEPPNCGGVGRIRHFHRAASIGWPANPLPIDPARRSLGLGAADELRAQVFQNAACNWRCWYCYVPYDLLGARAEKGLWLSAPELIDRWWSEPERPAVIVLSGGQPDLVPEWALWMMRELVERGLDHCTYLWSDDNLSNHYFWRFLTDTDRELLATAPCYGRVCCFKGFDSSSFAFNTHAAPELFERQFELFDRLVQTGMDLYAYATFTTPNVSGTSEHMSRFVERLQVIAPYLPLRVIPLEIAVWGPVEPRLRPDSISALELQKAVIERWHYELESRFTSAERAWSITDVPLGPRGRRRGA